MRLSPLDVDTFGFTRCIEVIHKTVLQSSCVRRRDNLNARKLAFIYRYFDFFPGACLKNNVYE